MICPYFYIHLSILLYFAACFSDYLTMLEQIYSQYPDLLISIKAISVALLVGGMIGLEREKQHKPAGIRTNILICLGATVFTLISRQAALGDNSDPSRIVAQIVTGVGFLGAGAIMRQGTSVQGLTTAAEIWVAAALGICCGYEKYLMAILVGVVTIIVLETSRITSKLNKPHQSPDAPQDHKCK